MLTDVPRHDARVIKLHYRGEGEIKNILYFVGKVIIGIVLLVMCLYCKLIVLRSLKAGVSYLPCVM